MAVDVRRRKSVMARSMRLGHCVCNPRSACPCETFKLYNVCACAGEKMPVKAGPVALTRYVRRAGCASKIGQADLLRLLGKLPPVTDPNVLVGMAAGDDAGVYRIDDGRCLVQTVDVFTPCVDDARLFGRIAAANSLSDVYAMGGRPLTALSIVGFPIDDLDGAILEEMLRGGMEKLEEAGCALIGGHSIQDEEVKLGFAVTGLIEAWAPVVRAGARPGDALVITKPIGTGMISFAAQIGRSSAACLAEAGASMATLNKDAADLMMRYGANACTDVTGFGLAGHLVEMARGSGVDAEIDLSALPVFRAAAECLEREILSGAIERNQEYAMGWVEVAPGVGGEEAERALAVLYDPQTSGGLLVSLPADRAGKYVSAMRRRGHKATGVIGRVVRKRSGKREGRVVIVNARISNLVGQAGGVLPPSESTEFGSVNLPSDTQDDFESLRAKETIAMKGSQKRETVKAGRKAARLSEEASEKGACCAGGPADAGAGGAGAAGDTMVMFQEFMKAANAPGAIDRKTKKLMAVALSIALRCEPCLKSHLRSALAMGITREEIDEAAALAVSFGGCTAMMFYKEVAPEILG